MAELLELTVDIVTAHVSMTEVSSDELIKEIRMVYATLKGLEQGDAGTMEETAAPQAPSLTIGEAFKPDQVACMVCGKHGLKTLKRHLAVAHDMKPGQYRKQFGIPKEQPLAAMEYVEKRRQMALDRKLGDNLARARAAAARKKTKKGKKKAAAV
jgi:predicted transcriptional regulator